jgi:hypothetical protein
VLEFMGGTVWQANATHTPSRDAFCSVKWQIPVWECQSYVAKHKLRDGKPGGLDRDKSSLFSPPVYDYCWLVPKSSVLDWIIPLLIMLRIFAPLGGLCHSSGGY